jgi:hypothetical protein
LARSVGSSGKLGDIALAAFGHGPTVLEVGRVATVERDEDETGNPDRSRAERENGLECKQARNQR